MKKSGFKKRDKYIIIILVIAFLLLFTGIFVASRIGNRLYTRYVPLTKMASQASIRVSQAHLLFEEFLHGDTTVSMHQVEAKILQAKGFMVKMGKSKNNGITTLVPAKNTQLQEVIDSSLSIINKFYFLTHERFTKREIAKTGSEYDIAYDDLHGQLHKQLNILRAATTRYISQQLRFFNLIEIGLQVLTILVFLYIIYAFRRYVKQRNRHLYEIEGSKKQLQQRNEEILTQNEEIKTQNEDLEEILEQLQASKYELMESEERLKLSLSSTGQGLWDINLVTGEVNTTKELFTMLGYEPTEFEFGLQAWESLLHPADREFAKNQLSEYINGSIPGYANEFRLKTKDGKYKWILSKGEIIEYDHEGNPKRIIGTHIDITEKKKSEIALKEAAEIFNSSQNGMYIYELEDLLDDSTLLLINANPASEKLTGMSLNRIIGKYIDENFPNLRADGIPKKFAEVIRTQKPIEIETYQYSDDNISKSYYAVRAFPMPGQRVAVSFENNTEKVLTRHQLKDSEEKYRRLFTSAQDGIFLMKDYLFVDCNDYAMKLFECDYKDELLFKSPLRFSPAKQPGGRDSKEKALEKINHALQGLPQFFEWKHITKNEKLLDTDVSLTKLIIKDEVHLLAIIRDITQKKQTEQELVEAEQRWKFALEGAGDGLWDWNMENNEVFFSKRWKEMLGYEEHEIENRLPEWDLRVHPDDKENVYKDLNAHIKGQTSEYINEHRLKCKNGSYIWVLDRGKVLFYNKNGEPSRFVGTHSDITKRREMEVKLRYSEKNYRLLAESSYDIIITHDLEGNITYANPSAIEFTGYSKKELLEKNIEEFTPLEAKNAYESRKQGRMLGKDEILTLEMNCIVKGGKEVPVEYTSVLIYKDKKPDSILITARDITERKKAQDQLKNSEAKLKETQRIAKIASFEYNFTHKSYHFSDNFAEILCLQNFDPGSFLNIETYLDVVYPEDKESLLARYEKAFQQFEDFEFSFRVLDEKNNMRHINTINRYQLDKERRPLKLTSVIQDFTEQKLNEQLKTEVELAEETANIKQQFLANMSHEIRTPMTGIIGMIDFVLQTPLNKDQLEYIHTIKNSSNNLMSIVNDVLNLSKIEAGKLELYPKTFETRTMITDIVNLYKFKASEKGLAFNYQYDETIPNYIHADGNRVKQVVSNLVSNAIKYTGKGSVILKMKKEKQINHEEVILMVEVIDTGKGISAKDKKKLFTKFSQLKQEQGTLEGIGLGLVICKELVELMDGEIDVESKVGEGSRFWFRFKATIAEEEQEAKEQKIPYKLKFDKLILLAEDKLVNQKVISLMLKDMGCDVLIAKNGEEALNLFDKHYHRASTKLKKFDIILMDIQMPVMDGITAAKNLKENYENLPPIIGISANAMEGDAERYIEQGLDDYISKPVTREMLFKKLYSYCKK